MRVLKIAVVAVLLLTMLFTLCSCGRFECATCGEEKRGKRYTEELLGKEVFICKECHELGDKLNDILVDIEDLFD